MSTDKEILVPLTNSLYVPGKLKKTDTVIVDVGTGYFIEKVQIRDVFIDGAALILFPDDGRGEAVLWL